jgi:hypothetical protein
VKIFANTQPGDAIVSGRVRQQAFAPLGSVTFQLPAFPNATSYRLHVSCTSPALGTQPQFTVQPLSCPDAAQAQAVGWATDAAGNAISGPSVLRDFALQAGATIQLGAYDANAVITKQSSFTNFPAGATEARWIERFLIGTNVLSAEGSVAVPAAQMTLVSTVDWSASTMSFKPSGFGVVRVDDIQTTGSTSPFVIDAGDLLRGIRNASYDGTEKVIEWEEASAGQTATLVNAQLSLTNSDRFLDVELHAPYDPSLQIALPPLPAELSFGASETVIVRLTTQAAPGRTYGEMLSVVDTDTAFTLPFFLPAFTGRVFEAHD